MRLQLPAAVVPALRFEVLECVPRPLPSTAGWLHNVARGAAARLGQARGRHGDTVRCSRQGSGCDLRAGVGSHLELGWALPAERQFYEG